MARALHALEVNDQASSYLLSMPCLGCLFERIRSFWASSAPPINIPIQKPICNFCTDQEEMLLTMANRKGAAKILRWPTFSRNQNAIDERTLFADTQIPRIRKSRSVVLRCLISGLPAPARQQDLAAHHRVWSPWPASHTRTIISP